MKSSTKVKGGNKKNRYAVNIGAVWGHMATGGGGGGHIGAVWGQMGGYFFI